MHWYKHDISAYRRATARLKLLAHGVYRLLMDEYYAGQGPLPDDWNTLYRICGAQTEAERETVRRVADQYFPVNGDGYRHNERCDAELAEYDARVARNKANAKQRVAQRVADPVAMPVATPKSPPSDQPVAMPLAMPVGHTDRHTYKDLDLSAKDRGQNRTANNEAARQALGLLVKRPADKPETDPATIERHREAARQAIRNAAGEEQPQQHLDDNEPF